jgi:hypothetical protein
MRALMLTFFVALTAVVASTGATASRSSCAMTTKTIKGHSAAVFCGPATGALEIGGKSYHFKGGTCIWSGGTLILSLGTQVNGAPTSANNEGVPYLYLTSTSGFASVYAFSGAFNLGMSLTKVTAHGQTSGTFKGREPIGATLRFTGSYHC